MHMNKKQNLLFLFGVFVVIEVISFLSIDNRIASGILAVILTLLVAVLAWKNLAYGVYALLIELILGGKGYLFSLSIGGMRIPLRMLLFCAVFGIWFLTFLLRNKKFADLRQWFGALWWPYLSLVAMVVVGVLLGLYRQNGGGAVYLDANAFGYLLAAPLFFESLEKEENKKQVVQLWLVLSFWLAVKTIILFVLFSWFGRDTLDYLYRWVRNSGVGEITWLQSVRVFLQSQIFIAAAFLYSIVGSLEEKIKKIAPVAILFGSALLISQSRSFFVGMVIAIVSICFFFIWRKQFVHLKIIVLRLIVAVIGSSILVLLLTGTLFAPKERLTEDPGASSRRNQLPVLIAAIKQNPLGYGFGQTLTYKTTDPRALALFPSGWFTTYSFELGWLDFWLKIGVFGVAAYLWFLWAIIRQIWPKIEWLAPILALVAIHLFTPYLNHPLGIGLLLLLAGINFDQGDKNRYSQTVL